MACHSDVPRLQYAHMMRYLTRCTAVAREKVQSAGLVLPIVADRTVNRHRPKSVAAVTLSAA